MHIEELSEYSVCCHVYRRDMKDHGISLEDLTDRTQLGMMFIRKAAELSKGSTDYDWPGCGYSMEMKIFEDRVDLIFSERVDDYIYNLKQTAAILSGKQQEYLQYLINLMENSSEEKARELIRSFEANVRAEGK